MNNQSDKRKQWLENGKADLREIGKYFKENWVWILLVILLIILVYMFWSEKIAQMNDVLSTVIQLLTLGLTFTTWLKCRAWDRQQRIRETTSEIKENDMVLTVCLRDSGYERTLETVYNYYESHSLPEGDSDAFAARFKNSTGKETAAVFGRQNDKSAITLECLTVSNDFFRSKKFYSLMVNGGNMPADSNERADYINNLNAAITAAAGVLSFPGVVHFYYNGPIVLSAMFTQAFKNSHVLNLYHLDPSTGYVPVIQLDKSGNRLLSENSKPADTHE